MVPGNRLIPLSKASNPERIFKPRHYKYSLTNISVRVRRYALVIIAYLRLLPFKHGSFNNHGHIH